MREDFYQSQYGNEANKTALALAAAAAVASSSSSSGHKSHDANHHHYGHHHLRSADHRIGGGGDDDDDVPATRANSAAAFLWPKRKKTNKEIRSIKPKVLYYVYTAHINAPRLSTP